MAGSLYGPATPAGVFNYVLKRPTDSPYASYTQGFDSNSVFTENIDVGGRTPDGKVGYRFNVVHGEGESWAPESASNRTLASGAIDFYLANRTVIETNFSHYETNTTGLPGSITYFSKTNILLPAAVDPTKLGLGQPGAGTDLITNTGLVKLKHEFNNDWNFEIGGLYQDAVRNLFGITNSMTDNNGDFTVTKNFTAVPHFTIASNTASLNGKFDLFGFRNEVTIGTNGFFNGQYSYLNSIAQNNSRHVEPGRSHGFRTRQPQTTAVNSSRPFCRTRRSLQVTPSTSTINGRCKASSVHRSCIPRVGWRPAPSASQQSADGVVSPTVSLDLQAV